MTWWQIVVLVLFLAAVAHYTVKVIRTRPDPDGPPPGRPVAGDGTREDAG